MQLTGNPIHYNVLNVKEDATQEEIRTSYKSALLISHPDKLQKTSETTNSESKFLQIQTAWEILGNVKSRALYDTELQMSRQDDDAVADEIVVDDLMVETGGDVVELFYQCRCGDYFSLDSSELGEMGFELSMKGDKVSLQAHNTADMASIVLPCCSCSLKIRLMISKD
ncbi:putative DnaJ domain, Zinc finger, DPH-type, DPH Zinc finger superfamily [Helianthus annuus]|uniref:DnaJ domain, Zinc finger, DPH-type, DPH Zinc finger superfamily n=1 Tax=Helianthus annuus TaxID=4232 RepID=A0A251VDN5_HELAN|nr:DPH4 homolog [Helianthus annuus]XP_022014062.1 DPH4 homolog [Helianthus annuus]KAF5817687.1 putative DnaJ domain, Zinc finger, DPH-type, DPH Zinc finger superfamily [Helianthus annuus]KAJ0614532.1 putative DnaJ domain, DPH-type metal-binding domain, DPH-type metal-binding domain superfamily [Helianthus annuus]